MSLREIETAISQLSPADLAKLAEWFEEFLAREWDKQMEADLKAGRLDSVIKEAQDEFRSGKCKPL